MDEADVVAAGALALDDDMPAIRHRARVHDVDRRILRVGLHPRLEAAWTERGILPPDGRGDVAPAQRPIDNVGGDLASPQGAGREVPQWPFAAARLVDGAYERVAVTALHP